MKRILNFSLLPQKIDSGIRFFLYVLIFWTPYSSAVIEVCVIAALLLWILKRVVIMVQKAKESEGFNKKISWYLSAFQPKSSFLNKPIGFFLIACILSVVCGAFWSTSAYNFFTKTLEWFVIYFLVIEVFNTKKHVTIALSILCFTAFSTVLDALYQYHISYRDIFLGRVIEPGGRATAGFKAPTGLGGYLTIWIPFLSALLFFKPRKKWYRVGIALAVMISVWALILTFSRGAWLAVLCGGVSALLIVLFHRKKAKFYFALALILLTIFFLPFLSGVLKKSSIQLLDRPETIQWRLNIWQDSIAMIKERPFLGHGINTYMQVFEVYRRQMPAANPTYAHNCYIQLAAETGIVGLAGFLWIIICLFKGALSRIRIYLKDNSYLAISSVGLTAGISAFFIHSCFDTNFYSLQLSAYLWTMIGIQIAILNCLSSTDKYCVN